MAAESLLEFQVEYESKYGVVPSRQDVWYAAWKAAEEKFNSALRQPTGKLYNGTCAKNVIIYCQEFDPANKTCQSCDVRPTA